MHTLTTDELARQPQQLIDDARRGEASLVTGDGEPVFLVVPLGKGLESQAVRIELAAQLYDREQVSLGLAAKIAGLGYAAMMDELGRRGVPTLRTSPGDLARELAAFDA